MSDAREAILADIRRSLRREGALDRSVADALDARTRAHERHVLPAFDDDLVARFAAKLEALTATVTRVGGVGEVAQVVAAHIERHELPQRIVTNVHPLLAEVEWPDGLEVEQRRAEGGDQTAVVGAFAGIAETGTVVMVSGAQSPVTLHFLPEDHLLVLSTSRIVKHVEDAWDLLRSEFGAVPRTVNLLTGPSKTADVEQTIQIGAHGPRRFHVILVEG